MQSVIIMEALEEDIIRPMPKTVENGSILTTVQLGNVLKATSADQEPTYSSINERIEINVRYLIKN